MSETNLGSKLTSYLSQAGEKVRDLYNEFTLKDECRKFAEYFTKRANSNVIISSCIGKKSNLIYGSSGRNLIVKNEDGRQFVVDEYGIFVGMEEGDYYYELVPSFNAKAARRCRQLERSPFLRLIKLYEVKKLSHKLALIYAVEMVIDENRFREIVEEIRSFSIFKGTDRPNQDSNAKRATVLGLEQIIQDP